MDRHGKEKNQLASLQLAIMHALWEGGPPLSPGREALAVAGRELAIHHVATMSSRWAEGARHAQG